MDSSSVCCLNQQDASRKWQVLTIVRNWGDNNQCVIVEAFAYAAMAAPDAS